MVCRPISSSYLLRVPVRYGLWCERLRLDFCADFAMIEQTDGRFLRVFSVEFELAGGDGKGGLLLFVR